MDRDNVVVYTAWPVSWSGIWVGTLAALAAEAPAVLFVREAFKHCKAIAASGAGVGLLAAAGIMEGSPAAADASAARGKSSLATNDEAIVVGTDAQLESIAQAFIRAIARHRNWSREAKAQRVPA